MNSVKIKCLKGLPLAMAGNGERHLLKALETFAVIKSLWPTAHLSLQPETYQRISELSLRSTKTVKRRIEQLIQMKWLRSAGGSSIYLEHISWDDIRQLYGIQHSRFYFIAPLQRVQPEYLLKAKVFSEKKEHIRFGYKAHLKREALMAEIIQQVSGSLSSSAVAEHQLHNFLSEGKGYTYEEQYALSLRYTRRDTDFLNGNMEINYRTGTRIFGYQSDGGFAVLKRSLANRGVIVVSHRKEVIAKGTNTTTAKRKTRLGFVKYNEALHQVELIRPDAIEVVPNCHVDAYYGQLLAIRKMLNEKFGANA